MATYNGTPGNDSIEVFIPYADPGVVDERAYGYAGKDNIGVEYGYQWDEDWGSYGGSYTGAIELRGGLGNDNLSNAVLNNSFYDISPPDIGGVVNRFYGEAGDDTLVACVVQHKYEQTGDGVDYLYGGSGNDTYYIAEPEDKIIERAGEGVDTLRARYAYNWEYSEGYMVVLPKNVENLVLEPEPLDMYFNTGFPIGAVGNTLNNRIIGNEIPNELDGSAGNDTLYGKPLGRENVGMGDTDTIHGGAGNDLIYGAGGDTDTWDGADRLYGDGGNDRIFGHGGDDAMYGGAGNDEIGGQAGNDTMYGDAGIDQLGGGGGNDILYGGTGVDTLTGRDGQDRLYGQAGNDRFDYDAVTESLPGATLRDIIYDFAGIGGTTRTEYIDLSTIDANTGASGNQTFAWKGTAAFTAPGQLRVAAFGSSTVIQGSTDPDKAADFEIQVDDGGTLPGAWKPLDFML